jgi:hypothetical protein
MLMAGHRRELLEAATPEQVRAVMAKLYEMAVGGDVAAAKVWLSHIVGLPKQAVEISGPDGESIGPDLAAWTRVILDALAPFDEARWAAAAALARWERDRDKSGDPPTADGDPA